MSVQERRRRERDARHALIVRTAREIAEAEGWRAVTTRRLAEEIEYSQPVLYSHFQTMVELRDAVALEGFAELGEALTDALPAGVLPPDSLRLAGRVYLDFARQHPALYDAMFTLAGGLRFASADTPEVLRAGFAALHRAIGTERAEAETLAEVFWSALHGEVLLERAGRLRSGAGHARLELLIGALTAVG